MASFFSQLNPTPSFPPYFGPYDVGTVDVEIPAADLPSQTPAPEDAPPTVAFRLFYPCQRPTQPERPVRWVQSPQHATVGAFARFLGAGKLAGPMSWLPQQLYYATLPAHRNAPVLTAPTSNQRWPVTLFSHGLAGSRNSYSHVCGSMAANGMIVVALDHRDGSSPIQYIRATKDTEAKIVEPVRHSHKPCKKTYEGRDKQLRIRLYEICKVHSALLRIDAGEVMENLDENTSHKQKVRTEVLKRFAGQMDVRTPGKISFAGHSFGACTTVQIVKSVFYRQQRPQSAGKPLATFDSDAPLIQQITPQTSLLLLDMWCLALRSPDQNWLWALPLPSFAANGPQGANVISILSEQFVNWKGNCNDSIRTISTPERPVARPLPQWARLRDDSPGHDSGYSSESRSITDKAADSEGPLGSKGPYCFYAAKSQHFNQSDFGVLFPWVTKKLTKAEEPERILELNVRAMVQVLRDAGVEVAGSQDSEILDKDGELRGWINIPVGEQETEAEEARLEMGVNAAQDPKKEPVADLVVGGRLEN